MNFHDVIVVGAGQSGLSVAYFLRRTQHSVLLLDAEVQGGGAWQHAWESLRLFSPASWSSIAGWPMPRSDQEYPHRDEVIDYLRRYEERYSFNKIGRASCRERVWVSLDGGLADREDEAQTGEWCVV